MNVLGISCYFHDSAAALLSHGALAAAAQEERFSRRKHDHDFPELAIDFCLETAGIHSADLDAVVFFEKPLIKFERLLMTSMQMFPRSHTVFREAMITWMGDKLWVKSLIQKKMKVPAGRILFSGHHMSHAASAFLCSPFEESAILTIDGVGEWTTASIGMGKGNAITLLKEIRFPHSLGLLYSAFTAFLGFEVNEGEYKVMGMAPFGSPRHVDKVMKLLDLDDRGGFHLNMEYFTFPYSTRKMYSRKFLDLFGPSRDPKTNFFTPSTGFPAYFGSKPENYEQQGELNQYYADVAASIQAVTETVMVKMAIEAHRATGLKNLCMAGGVALNSVGNGKILKEAPFDRIYIQPAAGDDGAALGAALYGCHTVLGQSRSFVMEHAYWGEQHSSQDAETFFLQSRIPYERIDDEVELIGRVVSALKEGKVVGWSQGRFEWGPRALGNRSILADPRRADMKDIVNTKIKFREPYRPFAPSVLAERASEFFEIDEPEQRFPARFMLYVVKVRPGKEHLLPATTHVDGTARLQTVHRDVSPRYYRLIERFGEETGVPVLLNTSFNLRGEPIVNTPREAYQTFSKSDMDLLVVENCLVYKS